MDYRATMQCKPPTIPTPTIPTTTTITTTAPPPPPLHPLCSQTHLRSSCQRGVHRVGSNYHVAGQPPVPWHPPWAWPSSANASATHKKWHHFLVKRDERLPLLHIGPCYHARQSRYYRQYSDLSCSLSPAPRLGPGPDGTLFGHSSQLVHSTRAALSATRPRVATSWLAISGRTV